MALDLTGIQNVGEFYSHHYLDALLENDLKGLLATWRADDERTPDRRLNGLAPAYFNAKQQARQTSRARRTAGSWETTKSPGPRRKVCRSVRHK